MLNFKIILSILGLLLSFVTMAADKSIIHDNSGSDKNTLMGKTYVVRVSSPKAIVYADENMLSPIGYIANGKGITVGNPRRMNRDLVPLIIHGRLAFIEIKDIRYENSNDEPSGLRQRGPPREHNVDITIQRPEERLAENNSAYLGLHRYSGGAELKNTFYAMDGTEKDVLMGFHLQFIHRQTESKLFWGAGLDYSSVSSENMKFAFWTVNPTFGYTPFVTPNFFVDVYGSLDLGVNLDYTVSNNEIEEPSGYIWGVQANARAVFMPRSKYHAYLGIGIRKYTISGLSPLKDNINQEFEGISGITAVQIFAGLGIEFK